MPNKAGTKVTLEIDGAEFTNLQSYTENERVKSKQVKYMNKLGSAGVTSNIGFSVDAVLDTVVDLSFLENIENATIVVEYEGGRRVIFLNCRTESIGEQTANGEDEIVYPVVFNAEDRKDEAA